MSQKIKIRKKTKSESSGGKLHCVNGHGMPNKLALPIYGELSKEAGISYTAAKDIYQALGRVIQRRLILGKACGIPHVCTLFVEHRIGVRLFIPKNPIYGTPAKWADYRKRPKARPNVLWPALVREAISMEAPFGKSLREQYKNAMGGKTDGR